jgi:hypothetical protein
MTHYEELAIEGMEERAAQAAPVPVRKMKLANLMANGGNPNAVLMFCYHSCQDIRGAMKLIHACRYLRDPELYERCKRIVESNKHRRFKPLFIVMSPPPRQDYPEIFFLGISYGR